MFIGKKPKSRSYFYNFHLISDTFEAYNLIYFRKSCKSEKYNVELVEEHLVLDVENPERAVKIETCDKVSMYCYAFTNSRTCFDNFFIYVFKTEAIIYYKNISLYINTT